MKSKYFLTAILASSTLTMLAQYTQGGSRKKWEEYDVIYDTVMVERTVTSAYPPTSSTYLRLSLMNGRGLISEPSQTFFPENGFRGTEGHDMGRGYEFALGGYGNWNEVNKQLHPGIDFSNNWEVAFQFATPEYTGTESGYTVDYGTYYGIAFGYGIAATIKPGYFDSKANSGLKDLFIDLGYRLDLNAFNMGETTYRYESPTLIFSGDITSEDFALRLDGSFFVGLRYKFIGLRLDLANQLTNILAPVYTHSYSDSNSNSFTEEIESEKKYSFSKFSLMFFF
jgi:hypothetical protein